MTHHSTAPVLGELVDQPSRKPSAKLSAVGGTGLATVLVLWLASRAGLQLPTPVAEAIVLAGGWAGGYLKRDRAVAAVVTRVEHALTPILPAVEQAAAAIAPRVLPMLASPHVGLAENAGATENVGLGELLDGPVADEGAAEAQRGPEAPAAG